MKVSYVCFEEKDKAALRTEEVSLQLTETQVLVKADYDLISVGCGAKA